jgi:Spy/CpxP family protein refolding chaperone
MKQRIALLVLALLVPALGFAQSPAPVAVPPGGPGGFGGPPMLEDRQGPEPQHPGQPQPPHPPDLGKWWKNSDVVRELQLTDQQINQIEQNFLEHRLKLIDLKAEVERQETRLQPLIEADRPDEPKVLAQIDLVLAARGKLEKENATMMLSIRRVLSVEQWKKLEAIQHGRERMMRGEPYSPQHPSMRRMGPPAPPASTPPPRPPDSEEN